MKEIMLFTVFALLILQSCKKSDDDGPAGPDIVPGTGTIITLVEHDNDQDLWRFIYDVDDRLIQVEQHGGYGLPAVNVHNIEYNTDGNIASIEDSKGKVVFHYGQDTLQKTEYFRYSFGDTMLNRFEIYTFFPDKIRIYRHSPFYQYNPAIIQEYEMGQDGNVERYAYYSIEDTTGISTLLYDEVYEYDSFENPYASFGLQFYEQRYFGLFEMQEALSNNNQVKITTRTYRDDGSVNSKEVTSTPIDSYNEAGYPVSRGEYTFSYK